MSAFNKFNSFAQAVGRKVHNLHTDVLKVMLSNVAPVATNTQKSDLTEISAGNGYVAGGQQVANQDFSQTSGIAVLEGDDMTFTASGGPIGPFRYAILYNDSALNKELIGWWDYGTPLTLADGEAVGVDFDQVAGILDLQ